MSKIWPQYDLWPWTQRFNLVEQMQPASCGMASFKQEQMSQTKNHNQSLTQCVDLPEVFEYLGLSKYTDVFVQQEVKNRDFRSKFISGFFGFKKFGPD